MKKIFLKVVFVVLSVTFGALLSSCSAHKAALQSSNWQGEAYQQDSALQGSRAQVFFFPNYKLTGRERILDIGSGVGNITAEFAARLKHGSILGVDKSQSMVDKASQTFPQSQYPNLSFEQADAQDKNFYLGHQNEFDWVVSFSCLHWVKDHEAVFEGISRVLKNGGRTYLFYASTGGDPLAEIANEMTKEEQWAPYFASFHDGVFRFDEKDYARMFKQKRLPFKIIKMKQVKLQEVVAGREELIAYNRSWVQQLHRLPTDALKNQFLAQLVDNYLEKYPAGPDGKIKVVDHYIEVVLEKSRI